MQSRTGLAVVLGSLLACSGLPAALPGADPTRSTVSLEVSALTGGVLTLPSGVTVTVPAGALATDAVLTVSQLADPPTIGLLTTVIVEPHDLRLLAPATVTIPYDPTLVGDPTSLAIEVSSLLTEPRSVGSELSVITAPDPVVDTVAHTVSVNVDHFSVFHLFTNPDVFVTRDIPAKYLKAGDILYAMTDADLFSEASTRPMHVGILYRPADASNNFDIDYEGECKRIVTGQIPTP